MKCKDSSDFISSHFQFLFTGQSCDLACTTVAPPQSKPYHLKRIISNQVWREHWVKQLSGANVNPPLSSFSPPTPPSPPKSPPGLATTWFKLLPGAGANLWPAGLQRQSRPSQRQVGRQPPLHLLDCHLYNFFSAGRFLFDSSDSRWDTQEWLESKSDH